MSCKRVLCCEAASRGFSGLARLPGLVNRSLTPERVETADFFVQFGSRLADLPQRVHPRRDLGLRKWIRGYLIMVYG